MRRRSRARTRTHWLNDHMRRTNVSIVSHFVGLFLVLDIGSLFCDIQAKHKLCRYEKERQVIYEVNIYLCVCIDLCKLNFLR